MCAAIEKFPGISCFFSFRLFLRTHTACCKYEAALTSNEARSRERSDRARFLPLCKKASSYRGAFRVPLFKEPRRAFFLCVFVDYSNKILYASKTDDNGNAMFPPGIFFVCFC